MKPFPKFPFSVPILMYFKQMLLYSCKRKYPMGPGIFKSFIKYKNGKPRIEDTCEIVYNSQSPIAEPPALVYKVVLMSVHIC